MATEVDNVVNLEDIMKDINGLSEEQLKEQLLKVRVRAKVQQKKHQGSAQQKAYQAKQREKNKLLVAKAKELGIYNDINEQAEKLAEEKLAEEAVAGDE